MRRGLNRAEQWYELINRYPIDGGRMIAVKWDGRECLFDDALVDHNNPGSLWAPLLQGRFYEFHFLAYIQSLQIRGNYVDVGANIGTHTLFFAIMCDADHVYSFEPRAHVLEKLNRNLEVNGIADRVTPSVFALAAEDGEVTASLDGFDYVLVTRRLDDVVTEPVSVLKIDVEGMEVSVLRGATRILDEDCPVVFAEAHEPDDVARLDSLLAAHNYVRSGRVWNSSPTYEYIPTPERMEQIGWTGPTMVPPKVEPKPIVAPPVPEPKPEPKPEPAPPKSGLRRWARKQPILVSVWRLFKGEPSNAE